jgi:hypothetical protein
MSYNTGPKIVTDGLVLCLDAADRNSYPGSGSTWYDLSGNSYNNSLINSPSFNTANGGNIIFDGANDYAQITSSSKLTGITDVSASCYVNMISSGSAGSPGGIFNRYFNTTGNNGWNIIANISGSTVSFSFNGRESSAAYFSNLTNYDYDLNTWYYIVGVKQGTSWKVYVNGNLEVNNTNGNGTTTFGNNIIYFGGYPQFGTVHRSNFKIGLCGIYNRALSSDEITQNYNATKGRFGL